MWYCLHECCPKVLDLSSKQWLGRGTRSERQGSYNPKNQSSVLRSCFWPCVNSYGTTDENAAAATRAQAQVWAASNLAVVRVFSTDEEAVDPSACLDKGGGMSLQESDSCKTASRQVATPSGDGQIGAPSVAPMPFASHGAFCWKPPT